MLRFILILISIAVILKIGKNNPYIGFTIYLFSILCFIIYTINIVNKDEKKIKTNIEETLNKRKIYYDKMNSK